MYGFKSCNRCKGLSKIQAFNLREPLCNKSCLVSYHISLVILFVAEHSLGAYDSCILGALFKCPNLIAGEVVQFLMHGIHPIRILESFIYTFRLNARNKRVMFGKISKFL